jgi:regulator of replication initiation timing
MFGFSKIREDLERVTASLRKLADTSWRLYQLERENDDLRTWNQKVREKNAHLRRDRRRLRELLDANNVPWRS